MDKTLKEEFGNNAKIFSDIAEISADEATKILLSVMKTYEIGYKERTCMNNNLIQRARDLCSEATDAPWELYNTPDYTEIHVQGGRDAGFSPVALADEPYNAAFIAASRTLVPQLCNALEKSQNDIATLRNELCLKCGRYHDAHLGACEGCRWKT